MRSGGRVSRHQRGAEGTAVVRQRQQRRRAAQHLRKSGEKALSQRRIARRRFLCERTCSVHCSPRSCVSSAAAGHNLCASRASSATTPSPLPPSKRSTRSATAPPTAPCSASSASSSAARNSAALGRRGPSLRKRRRGVASASKHTAHAAAHAHAQAEVGDGARQVARHLPRAQRRRRRRVDVHGAPPRRCSGAARRGGLPLRGQRLLRSLPSGATASGSGQARRTAAQLYRTTRRASARGAAQSPPSLR